jgi:membrane protein implicated in regulation of membrane protease activity
LPRDARKERTVFPINDALDAILLGTFLFGILFTLGALVLGVADIGGDAGVHDHSFGDHGFGSLFNLTSILAFVTWFGGVGYLVRNGLDWHWSIALVFALAGGLLAAYIVRWFLVTVLRAGGETLDPREFERVGVLARVTSSIRAGGVGEIVWEQHGSRMVTSARAATTDPIARGTEVLILRVERGIAVVEPFDGLLNEDARVVASGG